MAAPLPDDNFGYDFTPQTVDSILSNITSLSPLKPQQPTELSYITTYDFLGGPASQGVNRLGLPSRGMTDDLCYGTGAVYLSGLSVGGAWGMIEGFKSAPKGSRKLLVNGILNSVTRRGPFVGNSLGVLAISVVCIDGLLESLLQRKDSLNFVGAATLAGGLFKSTAGIKPMGKAALVCGGLAALWELCWAYFERPKE